MLSSMAAEAVIYYTKHNHYTRSLTAMGVNPRSLRGKYFEVLDVVSEGPGGPALLVVALEGNHMDGRARMDLTTGVVTWD